jgi:hypothetical protein
MLLKVAVLVSVLSITRQLHLHLDQVDLSLVGRLPPGYKHRVHAGYLNVSEHKALYYVLCERYLNNQ